MRNAIHFLGGSVTVYVLMAACSAGSKGRTSSDDEMASAGGTSSAGAMQAAGGVDGSSAGKASDPTAGKSSGMGGIIDDMMDPVPDANANENGTRLKAKYYAGSDGSKQFTFSWRDTQRNEDCNFAYLPGGELRCIPMSSAARVYFADAGCTAPLWVAAKAAASCYPVAAAKYGTVADATGCTQELHTLQATTPTMVYSGTPANCLGSAAPDVYTYYASSGKVPFSEFVAATEKVD
jgi:hypothetical protein